MSNFTLLPAFDHCKEEGRVIGRLLAGYGELELELCDCMVAATNDTEGAIRMIFAQKGAERRIETFKRAVRNDYAKAGLSQKLLNAVADIQWCRQIRNQYAHSQWYYTVAEGLCFCDLEAMATNPAPMGAIADGRLPIDVPLLQQQLAFFSYTAECFWHLGAEYRLWAGKWSSHDFPLPRAMPRPARHN